MIENEKPLGYGDQKGGGCEVEISSESSPYIWLMQMFDKKLSHYRRVGKLAEFEEDCLDPKTIARACGPPLRDVYNDISQYLNLPPIGQTKDGWTETSVSDDTSSVELNLFSVARLAAQVIDEHAAVQKQAMFGDRSSVLGTVEKQTTFFNQIYEETCLVFGLAGELDE